jgi:hypothetical protein
MSPIETIKTVEAQTNVMNFKKEEEEQGGGGGGGGTNPKRGRGWVLKIKKK